MSQQRGTTTDQLNNVVQVLQLGRKSGRLIVEREERGKREEGEIVFASGQITDAHSGRLQGQKAFDWLKTWGTCRFIFVTATADTTIGLFSEMSPAQQINPSLSVPYTPPTAVDANWRKMTGPVRALPAPVIPRRIRQANEGLYLLGRAGLSRHHRHLFLLVDGQRTTEEIIRLMGRSSEEVHEWLHDLEVIGVIQK